MDSDEKSEFDDIVSFYMYKIKVVNAQVKMDYLYPVNVPTWIAHKHSIKNWSYEEVKEETEKAFLFKRIKLKKEPRWVAKSLCEIGEQITEKNDYYNAHISYIKEKEPDLVK